MPKKLLKDGLFIIAALLILISAVLLMEEYAWARFSLTVGIIMYIAHRAIDAYRGNDFRLKRLNRMHAFNALLLILAVYLVFKGSNTWIVALLIVAVVELYVVFRSAAYQKENEKH